MPRPAHESPMHHPTIDQWYSRTRVQKLTTSDSLDWNGIRLELAQHQSVPEDVSGPYLEVDAFAFLLKGTATFKMRYPGGVVKSGIIGPGTLQLLPRHTEYGGSWNAPWTYGALHLNREATIKFTAALFRGDPEKIQLIPTFLFNDPLLYYLGVELTNEMQNANPSGPLYAESLSNTITLYLLRHYSTGKVVRELSGGQLTNVQIRMIDEYINAHLDQKITLADLANHVHISVPHFERMFRAATHRPPYRYVLEIRLQQAKSLLEHTRLSLTEIASQCGFSSQSHFTAHFKRYTGVSPARYAQGKRRQH